MDAVFLRYLPPFFLFEKKSDFLLNLICFFGFWSYSKALSKNGAVAQLARAIRSHRIGHGFDSHQLHHFWSSKPLRTSKLQIRAVFSCPGLSTSFRACLFQNRIPIGYHYLSSKSWNWYPIFRVTIFSPVFPVFIHNPPDCPQWKSWKNFPRRVEKLKTGILLVSYHCQWSILSSKSMFC